MNILWLMVDQMRADHLGFAGHPYVQTPNLDRLAARGTVFENTFVQSPLCGPSRTSLFSGRYVHEHGVWWNGVPCEEDLPLLPEILRQAGYRTSIVGKLHLEPAQRTFGFQERKLHEELLLDPHGLDAYDNYRTGQSPPVPEPGEATEWDNRTSGAGVCRVNPACEETAWVADHACEALEQADGEQPFFLYASFMRPHSPYNPLPEFLDRYRDTEIEPPPFSPEEWDKLPPRVRATAESWGWDALTPEDFAEVRRHYAALCTQVDDNIGRIMQTLEQKGLVENTLIVFTSDHGDFLGEHGLLFKEHLYDASLHVPLVIVDPRRQDQPTRYTGLTESIDIMPTVLDLVGVEPPAGTSGESLTPVLDDPERVHRSHILSEWTTHTVNANRDRVRAACVEPHIASVRTQNWKYMHYIDEPGELYDLRTDPGERDNRFGDPDLDDITASLRDRLPPSLRRARTWREPGADNPYFNRQIASVD
jgi:choline-sulfatase